MALSIHQVGQWIGYRDGYFPATAAFSSFELGCFHLSWCVDVTFLFKYETWCVFYLFWVEIFKFCLSLINKAVFEVYASNAFRGVGTVDLSPKAFLGFHVFCKKSRIFGCILSSK